MYRVVILTRHIPYPPRGGAPLRNWQNINLISELAHGVSVLSVAEGRAGLLSHPVLAGSRHVDLRPRTVPGRILRNFSRHAWIVRPGAHPNAPSMPRAARELNRLLEKEKADTLVVEELWLYPYVDAIAREWQGSIVFDAHNVESVLRARIESSRRGWLAHWRRRLLGDRVLAAERRITNMVDQVWTCSTRDASILENLYGLKEPVQVIPNGIDPGPYSACWGNSEAQDARLGPQDLTLLFPGSFGYVPNQVAATTLIHEILPRVRASHTEARLILAGQAPTAEMSRAATADPGILVPGKVDDMTPYFAESHIVVIPLRHGGGTRLKILEAFAAGRPVVSSSVGAEGLDVEDGTHLLIADTPEDTAQAVIRLRQDHSLAEHLRREAYELVVSQYSWDAVRPAMTDAIAALDSQRRSWRR